MFIIDVYVSFTRARGEADGFTADSWRRHRSEYGQFHPAESAFYVCGIEVKE